jgi:Spy/CpxP family protein refolding chaperone
MRFAVVMGCAILGMTLLIGVGASQDNKKDKAKGFLPPGWKELELTAEQKDKAYKVLAEYKTKLNDLNESIKKLKTEERAELFKLLTDPQKEQLKKIAVGESTKKKDDKKADDKKADEKKSDDKK